MGEGVSGLGVAVGLGLGVLVGLDVVTDEGVGLVPSVLRRCVLSCTQADKNVSNTTNTAIETSEPRIRPV